MSVNFPSLEQLFRSLEQLFRSLEQLFRSLEQLFFAPNCGNIAPICQSAPGLAVAFRVLRSRERAFAIAALLCVLRRLVNF